MSNKADATTMEQATKRELTPKLRFPEFRDAGEWEEKQLNQVLVTISNGLNLDQINDSTGFKVTRIETISDLTIDLNKIGFIKTDQDISQYRLNIGDILLSNINSLSHIGKTVIVDRDYGLYHGMNLLRLVVEKNTYNPTFVFYLLNTEAVKLSIRSRANKAVNQASINQTELGRTIIVATKRGEQQKIADCLSSIDELIIAQTQKLDTLKAHKKGLMQQLFPADGETLPKLRFPEFRDAGEWKGKRLFEVCEINPSNEELPESFIYIDLESVVAGKLISKKKINREGAPSRAQRLLKNGDVIYQIVRPYQRNNFFCDFNDGNNYVASTGYAQLRSFDASQFLYQLIHTDTFVNKVIAKCTGSNYPAINSSDLAEINVAIPKLPEQQKIADCLSSIDELVAAQTQKLDTLKAHKKGLMQQLFPSAESQKDLSHG